MLGPTKPMAMVKENKVAEKPEGTLIHDPAVHIMPGNVIDRFVLDGRLPG